MEYQHKLLLVTVMLVAVALYITFTLSPAPAALSSEEAEALLVKSAGFGKGIGDYTYAYSEVSDGYRTSYVLARSDASRYAEIQNPLSTKKVYMLPNDTIFCIRYPTEEYCASVINNSEMQNYISFVESKFFNDTLILRAESSMEDLIEKGYLKAEPQIENGSMGSFACSRVRYSIDYSNATVADAALYGIGAQSPKEYSLVRCMDASSGLAYSTGLEYSDNGMVHEKNTTVSAFRESAPAITSPAELAGDAVGTFRKEREQQVKLATCHTSKEGAERDKCVSDIAFGLKRKDICEIAGTKRDTCLLSVVSLTKDQTICQSIRDSAMKDSCYIELAGAYKDSSYCDNVADGTRKEACLDAAEPKEAADGREEGQNVSGLPSQGGSVDINELLEAIDKSGHSASNDSEENSTGGENATPP